MRILSKVFTFSLFLFALTCLVPSAVNADPLNTWQETTSLDSPIAGHTSLNFGENIYTVNGASFINSTHPDTWQSISSVDGTISPWVTVSQIANPLIGLKSITYNNFGYLVGGLNDQTDNYTTVNTVSMANFTNGALSPWTLTDNQLPIDLAQGGLIHNGNKLYYIGGYQIHSFGGPEIPNYGTYLTEIEQDGSITNWNYTTPMSIFLNQPTYYIGVAETGKKILSIGGKKNSSDRFSRTVFQSDINPLNGELGQWSETYPLPDNNGAYPTGYNSVGVVRVGDYIFAIGGAVCCGNQSNKVYYTTINNTDGSINPWETSQFDLPIRSGQGSVVYANGYIYYIGGFSNDVSGGYHDRVFYTKVNVPAITPTPTPTPTPQPGTNLNVPDIKQYSLPWGPLTYDHSKSTPPTISRWGCGLTSATMILQYHGSLVTPEGLNDWLKQNNGYTGNGSIKWPSVSAYSMYDLNAANLEFLYPPYSENLLKDELLNNRPSFIKLANQTYGGNHFVATRGFDNLDIFINDPAKVTISTLADANNFWGGNISIGKFTPSNTDLSYITLFINNQVNLKVFDPSDNEIGNEYFHTEYPELDPDNPESIPQGGTQTSFYFPKPQSGVYRIELTGIGNYELDSTFYDVLGNSNVALANGNLDFGETETLYVQFNQNQNGQSILLDDSVMDLFNFLAEYDKSNISKKGVYNHIRNSILNINGHILSSENNVATSLIDLLNKYIEDNKNKQIDPNFYLALSNKLQDLYVSVTLNSYLANI